MASINLKELSKQTNLSKSNGYTYIDLHFDIAQQNRVISNNRSIQSINGKDIQIDFDEGAIRNSILNILNTRQGERMLLPTFGCNLLEFIALPVSTTTGQMIGNVIYNSIKIWEPRVTIDKVLVVSNPDEHEYDITVNFTIPALKKRDVNLIATFTSNGTLESIG